MLLNLKALVVVLTLATIVFALAKPLCLRFTSEQDFDRRRWVWIVLTVASFASPSFWLYFLVAAPLTAWAGRKDSTPIALYVLLMFVVPPIEVRIPTIGIGQLFTLSNIRMLAFTILIPAVWARLTARGADKAARISAIDVIVLAYCALQLVLFVPYESFTHTARRAFLFGLDVYLVYFAFSRLIDDKEKMADVLGALCLVAAVFAPIAVFESIRGWLLYVGIGDQWGNANLDAYLMRGDSLRAQAATGHSITLGYIFAMALGCALYLKALMIPRAKSTAAYFLLVSVGLAVTYARGPWLTAAVVAMAFAALARGRLTHAVKSAALLGAAVALFGLTPWGARIVETLPYIGTQNQESVIYREQLAELSWTLVKQNPFFGSPFVLLQMEELRPGEGGIIDIVNGYAQVALFYGLVGLALYVGAFGVALAKGYGKLRVARSEGDVEAALIGSSLIACMLATQLFIATAGSAYLQWILTALLAAYASLPLTSGRAVGASLAEAPRGRQRQHYAI